MIHNHVSFPLPSDVLQAFKEPVMVSNSVDRVLEGGATGMSMFWWF